MEIKKIAFPKKLTFADYFNLNYSPKELVAYFDYTYNFKELNLPQLAQNNFSIEQLKKTYQNKLPLISLNSEIAKREFYIAPLLLELLDYIKAEINVEYTLNVGENLNGVLDYLIKSVKNLIIIEAKKGDLERGFNQLAIELIAMDKFIDDPNNLLYGVVTLGDIWRFGVLDHQEKTITKDMNAYIIPSDLEQLFSILLGILS
jgi:hypothetical protein